MSQCCPPFPTILFQSWSRRGRVTRIWLGQVTGGQIFSHLLVEWWRKRKHTHGLEIAGTERRRLLLSNCFVNVVITLWPPSESGINAHWTDTDIIWVSSFLYFSEHVSKRRQTKRLWGWGDDELEWKVAIDLLESWPSAINRWQQQISRGAYVSLTWSSIVDLLSNMSVLQVPPTNRLTN